MKTKKVLNNLDIFNFEPCIKWDQTSYMKWSHNANLIVLIFISSYHLRRQNNLNKSPTFFENKKVT